MKKSTIVFLCLIGILLPLISADKILVLVFFSSKSHKITYMPLMEELAKKGHEITIISPIKASKPTANITEIFTFDYHDDPTQFEEINMFDLKENGIHMNPFLLPEYFGKICEMSYDLPQVQNHFQKNPQYDLVFVQPLFNDCVYGLVHKLKAPLVLFFPAVVPQMMVSKIGGDFPSSFVGNLFLGLPNEMNFIQRMTNFGVNIFTDLLLEFYFEPYMANIYREKLHDPSLPSVKEIMGNASLLLSNGHFSLSGHKPYLPDVIDVGGMHSRPASALPKDLEDFVSKSGKDGFILFSMGSAIKGSMMSEAKRKVFIKVFSQLKQQVLWKWETETMPDLPKNVKLSKWLPQQDLLGHPNIRMFITHCGGGGTEEAIYHGVPLLGLPMFGDQMMNAKQALNNGYLFELDWNELTEDSLKNGINEILNNPKYSQNVEKLSKIFKDQPDQPLQRGVFWIEYILRHKGATHLRSASRKLNYFQYHSFDVIAAYLTIIGTALFLIYSILKFIITLICCSSSRKPSSKDLKKKKRN